MRYVERRCEPRVQEALRAFPALVLTGPRRAGKTTLLRNALPGASYHLLEDPAVVARLRSDPATFLEELTLPAILDEVQNVPELFAHVRARIDGTPRRVGRYILTGSQEASLMRGVTESMAGRAAMLSLWPLSILESPKVSLVRGGFPEVLARPRAASLWFSSYLQTYLERDVRSVLAVHDLSLFRRFMALVASRHGQILNKTDLATPLGISVPGVTKWLDVLEATQQILLVPPYFENFAKRVVKSPRLYVADSGLACHLLGIESDAELARSPFLGALWEGMVASEIVKTQAALGRRRELYFFRDHAGLEVDFLVPARGGVTWLVEAKATRTPRVEMARPIASLLEAARQHPGDRTTRRGFLVHRGASGGSSALAPGVRTGSLAELLEVLR